MAEAGRSAWAGRPARPGAPVARPDLSSPRRVHVIGAGGAAMSAIATVLAAMGHQVGGSDTTDSPALRRLAGLGIDVHVGHQASLVIGADVVVRSTAVPDDDPEVVAARTAGMTVWRRADVLAAICALRRTAAVSGTHGKTTTSSMLAVVLRELGWHPSIIVGGNIAGLGSGAAWDPAGDWLVVEADESDGTFVELGAEAVIVTSVEADHLAHYGGIAGLEAAFERYVTEASGPVVVCADDPGAARLATVRREVAQLDDAASSAAGAPVLTYGTSPGASVRISEVELRRDASEFTIGLPGGRRGRVRLAVPGLHNVRNAAGALTAADSIGAPWPAALEAIGRFEGVARRFERRGEAAGVDFVDGYDHLPTEVAAAIATARVGGWSRIVAVFQPHRYSRTEALWADFADAFVGADVVVITGVYAAGEAPRPGVTGRLVHDAIGRAHPETDLHYAEGLEEAAALLAGLLRPGDLCLTLGAGDVTTLADRMMARFRGSGEPA